MTTVLLAGGGTAGHVNPLLALADHWRSVEPEVTVLVLGTEEGLESRLVPARGYELVTVAKVPFPRRLNRAAFAFPGRFRAAVQVARCVIRERHVDVVVGFGGYASAPAYVAAQREGIPLVAHEANARPGIANRLARLLGGQVGVTFADTPIRGARVVGMPLRAEIVALDRDAHRAEARSYFSLDADKPVLLVTGGSTGAQRLNDALTASAKTITDAGWQVVHVTGKGRGGADPGVAGYHTLEYCDRMDLAFSAADLVLSRAGSATVSELAALGLPSVLVPYAAGNGEQKLNARELVSVQGAVLVADADLTPQWVATSFVPLLNDRATIARMAHAASTVGRRGGSAALLDLVRESLDSSSA